MYKARLITHEGKRRIAVEFDNKPELIQRFKLLSGATWSRTLKCWHLPDTKEYRKLFKISVFENKHLPHRFYPLLERFVKWLRSKRYSESTIKTYSEVVAIFFAFHHDKQVDEITNNDVVVFNNEYILKRKLSSTYQNQTVNALKLFYRVVENRNIDVESIHRPRVEHRLPHVLSMEEVKQLLQALPNVKHRVMLSLIYACGLRRSELLNLRPTDIDSKRMTIFIQQSKGKKDRLVPLTEKILHLLREYYILYRPKVWLFEGQEACSQYSPKSLQNVMKMALKKSNINKPATLHWLRHSYATHLLDKGTDLRYIQELLGHNSSRTTEIYTHVSTRDLQRIRSPFDDL
ncbi:MAG TPA: site-specific integrase [Taishania sp.]|nr:site-specific integrase [Taishania sp.]